MYNIYEDKFEVVELLGKKALFTEERISETILPDGLYKYDLREGDDPDTFYYATVEKNVLVNHAGTILTTEPIDLGPDGYIAFDDLDEDESLNFDGSEMTIPEYLTLKEN